MYTSKGIAMSADQTKNRVVDLRSDTLSLPTPEMRIAMANAAVGDDVYGEDPTVNELEARCAKLFGKDAALFVPSGSMANLLAVMVHCNRRGSEAIVGDQSHVFCYEQGTASQIAGVQINIIKNNVDGTFCLEEFQKKIRYYDVHEPITALAVVENTHNMCGGKVIPLEFIEELSKICIKNNIKLHMDGARVFNSSVALNVPVSRIVRDVDSVCFCLSKGLSAPVGSIILGSTEFIHQAHRCRKALGGAMRQVGILAAAGLWSLDNIVPILHEDHRRVKQIAAAIAKLNSRFVRVDSLENIHTNILLMELIDPKKVSPSDLSNRCVEVREDELSNNIIDSTGRGICLQFCVRDWSFVRLVMYHQITDEETDLIIKKLIYVINEFEKNF